MKPVLSIIVLVALAQLARAQSTWYVDVNGTPPGTGTALDPYTSIQYAHNAATTVLDDVLLVQPGVYAENLFLTKRLQIVGVAGPLATVVSVQGGGPALRSWASGRFEGFTLRKSVGGPGAEVVDIDGLTIVRCIVLGTPQVDGIRLDSGDIDHVLITSCREAMTVGGHPSGDIRNSILWGNDVAFQFDSTFDPTVVFWEYCIVDEILGNDPTTNIAADPRLWDLASGDFRLAPGSPCIDAGDPAAPLDLDGSRTDIGPLPFDPTYAPPPTVYCTAKSNSLTCVPAIGSSGSASASGSAFVITCTNELNQRPGLLFYGYTPQQITFQGGWLCVKAPTKRTPVSDSGGSTTGLDCTGAYAFDFDARIQSGIDPALVAGEIVFCQFWSRDGGDPTGFGSNRSDALRFGIAP